MSTASLQSTCHSAPVCKILSKSDRPQQKKMTSCRFSRWLISAILDFRGPIMGSLKSSCTTSYRSSIETIALNCLVFEKIAFLHFGDRRTDGQLHCTKPHSLSRAVAQLCQYCLSVTIRREDGYRWRQNGIIAIPKQKPVIRKIHFDNIISTGSNKCFRKFVYSNADEEKPEYVVVQYVGDASSAENFPHGKYQPVVDSFQRHHVEATRLGFSQRRQTWGVVCQPVLFRLSFFS